MARETVEVRTRLTVPRTGTGEPGTAPAATDHSTSGPYDPFLCPPALQDSEFAHRTDHPSPATLPETVLFPDGPPPTRVMVPEVTGVTPKT